MPHKKLTLSILPDRYAICKLESDGEVPEWTQRSTFWSVTKTQQELSILCAEDDVPGNIKAERGWKVLKVEVPLDFSLTGIIASLTGPLAEANISVLVLSAYKTDYVMVRESSLDKAISILSSAGHIVINKEHNHGERDIV